MSSCVFLIVLNGLLDLIQNKNCCNLFSKMPHLSKWKIFYVNPQSDLYLWEWNFWHYRFCLPYKVVAFLKKICSNFDFGPNLNVWINQSVKVYMSFWWLFGFYEVLMKTIPMFYHTNRDFIESVGTPTSRLSRKCRSPMEKWMAYFFRAITSSLF